MIPNQEMQQDTAQEAHPPAQVQGQPGEQAQGSELVVMGAMALLGDKKTSAGVVKMLT